MYTWLINKRKGKVHQIAPDGRTYCQVENNGPDTLKRLSKPADSFPKDRRLCWCCKKIQSDMLYANTHGKMDSEFRSIMQ